MTTTEAMLESALLTLRMIASASEFKDALGDNMIMAHWKVLAQKEVALIEQKKAHQREVRVMDLEELREICFGNRCPDEEYESKRDQQLENE